MNDILQVNHIEKYYGNKGNITKALDSLSFSVQEGEFIGIMGPSGSGKTTLLNCVATIDKVTSGQIIIDGKDIVALKKNQLSAFRRDQLGFIFQDFNLLDTLTAYENIALSLSIHQVNPHEIKTRIMALAKLWDIEECLAKYPYQLSGGQQQRVACARALVSDPSLVLADEPTGALDSKSSRVLLESLSAMNERYQTTIMMVTHDTFSASYCQRILFIKDGKIFNEISKGTQSRKAFFNAIMDVLSVLGGDSADVL